MKRIVIIGGGITGLAAAHRLVKRGQTEVVLLEAADRVGGVIHTQSRDGFLLERGPDSFISEKPEAIELAREIGLESHLIETNQQHRRSFIVRNGKLRPVPEGFHLLAPAQLWPFITSDIFSWPGKLRMAIDLILPRRNTNGAIDESLASFVRRRLGREALERMAQPMVGGIYTADPERLSLRATMPRFLDIEKEHRSLILGMMRRATLGTSGARYSLFLSFDRGMQLLVDQLAARLPSGTVKLNTSVESVQYDPTLKSWAIKTSQGEEISAGGVCITLPAYPAAQLLRSTNSALADELEAIPYASTATVNLGYKRADIPHPLNGFGFVVPFIENRSIIACTFSSVKFAGRAPEGHALLRAFAGGAMQPEMFELDEEEMIRRVRTDLQDLLGITQLPLFAEVARWKHSMPQYELGHLEKVKRINEHVSNLAGLQLAGNAYSGPGIPDCIRSATSAADALH